MGNFTPFITIVGTHFGAGCDLWRGRDAGEGSYWEDHPDGLGYVVIGSPPFISAIFMAIWKGFHVARSLGDLLTMNGS